MATADRILQLKLVSDVSSAQKGMKTMQKDMTKVQKAQGRLSSGFKQVGLAIGALGAVSIGVDILKGGIEDMLGAEEAARNFRREIETTSRNVPRDMRLIDKAMQDALAVNIDDTDFQNQVTSIIRRLRVNVPRGIRIAKVAINLAAAGLFPDAATAGNALVRALRGNKKALDDLGVPMAARKSDAKTLAFLERKYGKAAEDNANTLPGRWETLQTKFHEMVEGMVTNTFHLADQLGEAVAPLSAEGTGGALTTSLNLFSTLFDTAMGKVVASGAKMGVDVKTNLTNDAVGITTEAGKIGTGIKGAVVDPVALISGLVNTSLRTVERVLNSNVEPIRTASQGIGNAIKNPIVARMEETTQKADDLTASLISALDQMRALLQATKIPGIGRIFAFGLNPRGLAEGGIVTRPTLAMIGEKGPEAVVPLSGGGSGFGNVTINVYAGVGDPVEIGRQVDRVLRAYRVRAGVAA